MLSFVRHEMLKLVVKCVEECNVSMNSALRYEGWNFNGGNYLFTTDTK